MFQSHTTIIVGAGASFDYGLPSGPDLWSNVRSKVKNAYEKYQSIRNRLYPADTILKLLAQESPTIRAIVAQLNPPAENAIRELIKLSNAVEEDDVHSSVDDFLLDNPSLTQPIKAIVATHLLGRIYTQRDGIWIRRPELIERHAKPADTKNAAVPNWIRMFVGLCRGSLRSAGLVEPVTIINFNYDRVMETVLRHFWHRAEESLPDFEHCFRFIYPYGAFALLPDEIRDHLSWIKMESSSLGFAGGQASSDADELRYVIGASRTIFMVGFSCGASNAALLGLDQSHGSRIFFQNFELKDKRLNRTLAKLGTPESHADAGNCSQLVANGFFEQEGTEGSAADDVVFGGLAPPMLPRRRRKATKTT